LCITACGSTSGPSTPKDASNYSGFLSDYSKLMKVDAGDDSNLMRHISSDVKARGYKNVMLDPVTFYPAPQSTNTISRGVLAQISSYFNRKFSESLSNTVNVVDMASEDTLRIKMAITGVKIEEAKLKAYQYVPIAFLVNAASGGMDDVIVKFQIEAEVVDSLTGEVLGAAVKSGEGEKLNNDTTALTLDNLKPLIDKWAITMQKTMAENL
jgi:hypothetical protein